MKIADLKRPDLQHISCGICGEAFQDPEPPDLPTLEEAGPLPAVGYFDAIEQHGRFLSGDPELARAADAGHVERWEQVIRAREVQAATYRLSNSAVQAFREHAEQAHTLDEHLGHAHGNRIPLACEGCGHEEPATQQGVAALKAHECGGRSAVCAACSSFEEGKGLAPGQHLPAYPSA